jgi:hypothetical protein
MHTIPSDIMVGDCVYMYVPHLSKSSNCRKLTQFWTGPFLVVDKTSPVNCRPRNIQTDKDLPVSVHVNRLKPAYDRFCRPTQPPTDPEQRTDIPELSHNDLNMEDVERLCARRPNNCLTRQDYRYSSSTNHG